MKQGEITSWQVGKVSISRIVEVELPVAYHEKYPFMREARPDALKEIPWLFPDFVTPQGELRLSIHALLIQAPGLKLLVDTCIGNDKPRKIVANQSLQTNFLEQLSGLGCPRESIDKVVCTHLHVDHVGWNTMLQDDRWVPSFPNARYLIGRIEYDHWSAADDQDQIPVMQDSVAPIFAAGLADLVETDHRISPEIRLLPSTGHTPGHVSIMIESEGQKALITGDFMHHPCQIARPDWAVSFDVDQEAARTTRRALLARLADAETLVIGTHFAHPTAGFIVQEGEQYRFESSR